MPLVARKLRVLVWKSVLEVCRADESLLKARRRGGVQRGVMAWALQRHAGLTQRQPTERLGLTSGAAVSLLLRRLVRISSPRSRQVEKWQQELNLLFKGCPQSRSFFWFAATSGSRMQDWNSPIDSLALQHGT